MRKAISWVVLFAVYVSAIVPFAITAEAQVIGKAMRK